MARIYNPEEYKVAYQGSGQSVGFNPVRAVNLSAREKQRTQNELANLKLTEKTLNRTQSIESAQLKAQQVGESAIMKAEQAQQKANTATLKGLASLSGTLAKGIGQYKMIEAEEQARADEIDSVFTQPLNGYSMGEPLSPVPQEQEQDFGIQQQAAGEATIEIAEGDPVVQSELMAPAIKAGISRNTSRSNTYTAAAGYDAFLAGFMEQKGVMITRPDGSKFPLNAPESEADLAAVMSFATSTYGREAGIRGMDRAAVQRTLLPQVRTANNYYRRQQSALIAKRRSDAALDSANGTSFDGLGSKDNPGIVFQNTFNSLVGVDGRSKGMAKKDALEILLENAVTLRVAPSVLDELDKYVVPGTGTPLGKGVTGAMIAKARRDLADGVHNDYQRENRVNNRAVEDLRQRRQEALEAAGTDADKIAEVEKNFAEQAKNFGKAGREFRSEIMENGYEDSQVAKDLLSIEAEAGNLTIEDIEALEGYDTKFIAELKATVDPDAVKADATVKTYKADINAVANEITKAIGEIGDVQIDATGNVTSQTAAKLDIKMRLTADLRKFARLNPKAEPKHIAEEMRALKVRYIAEIDEAEKKAKEAKIPYVYKSQVLKSTNSALKPSGVGKESGMRYRDLTGLSTGQLRDASFDNTDNDRTNDVNPSSDRILTKKELIEASELYVSGGAETMSPRIKALADIVKLDPRVFLEQQNQAYGQTIDLESAYKQSLTQLSPVSSANDTERRGLDVIAKYESSGSGDYNAVNQGGAAGGREVLGYKGAYSGLAGSGGRNLTDLTVKEVMELQADDGRSWDQWYADGKIHGAGRYQFRGTTLKGLVDKLQIDPNTKFSPQLQDSLALNLLRSSGAGQWTGVTDKASASEKQLVQAARILQSPSSTAAQVRRASSTAGMGSTGPTGALSYSGNQRAYRGAGTAFQNAGFQVREQKDFGGVDPVHSSNSYHNYNEAFDVTHQTGDYATSIAKTRKLKEIVRSLGLFKEVIGPGDGDPNHETHLHLGGLLRPITPEDMVAINSVR